MAIEQEGAAGSPPIAGSAGWAQARPMTSEAIEVQAPDGVRSPPRGATIRTALLAMVGLLFLALIATIAFDGYRQKLSDVDAGTRQAAAINATTVMATERFLARAQQVLSVLALRPGVRALDADDCDPMLLDLPRINPAYTRLFTLDALGYPVCGGARRKANAEFDPKYFFDQVATSRRFTVGKPEKDSLTGGWFATLAFPIADSQGRLLGAVGIAVDLENLHTLVDRVAVPPGGAIGILDGTGMLIAHSRGSEHRVGTFLDSEAAHAKLRLRNGTMRAPGRNGVERLVVFKEIDHADWIAFASLDATAVLAPTRAIALNRLEILGALIALLACVTFLLARRITRPIEAISATMSGVRSGDARRRATPGGPREIRQIAIELNAMLDAKSRSEAALIGSEAQLNEAQHNAHIGSWRVPMEGAVTFSDEMYDLYNLPRGSALTCESLTTSIHGDDLAKAQLAFSRMLEPGATDFELDYRVVWPEGQVRELLALGHVKRDAQGRVIEYFGTSQDVTDRHQVYRELRELNDNLERRIERRTAELLASNYELDSFAYAVAHDLRAPLRSVDGFAHLLATGYSNVLDRPGIEMLARLRGSAQRMGELIDDLLRIAQVSRTTIRIEVFDMAALARIVFEDLQRAEPGRDVVFVAPASLVVRADLGLLKVLLQNLLGNAWKFTAKRATARIELGQMTESGVTSYFVRDDGAGFDMAYAMKLFTPFSRLHSIDEFPGPGIGLATVQRIVQRHGGRVWATGVPGVGATLNFTLLTTGDL
jgi:signal transduction histidine kinase/HAMP domain-containing protein